MPTDTASNDAAPSGAEVFLPAADDSRALRIMKIVVIVLGIALVLGFFTVVGRMIYLTSRSDASLTARSASGAASAELPAVPVPVPYGAEVRHLAIDGGRMAVHLAQPGAAGTIIVVETATGRVISRIELQRSPAGMPATPQR